MKFSTVATVAALAVAATAQDLANAPKCALTCLSASDACTMGDFKCMCSNDKYKAALQKCICSTCQGKSDQDAAAQLAISTCKTQGIEIPASMGQCPGSGSGDHSSAAPASSSAAAPASSSAAGPSQTASHPSYGSSSAAPSQPASTIVSSAVASTPCASATAAPHGGNATASNPPPAGTYTAGANTIVPGVLAFVGVVAAFAL